MDTKDEIYHYDIEKINNKNIFKFYEINENIEIDKLIKIINITYNTYEILKTKLNYLKKIGEIKIYDKIDNSDTLLIEQYTKEDSYKFIRSYDLFKDQLFRIEIIENKILMIDINHIVEDGYSLGILINEFNQLYRYEEFNELPIQYSDYAIYYEDKLKMKI